MFYKTGLLSRGLTIEAGLTIKYLRYVIVYFDILSVCIVSKASSGCQTFKALKVLFPLEYTKYDNLRYIQTIQLFICQLDIKLNYYLKMV